MDWAVTALLPVTACVPEPAVERPPVDGWNRLRKTRRPWSTMGQAGAAYSSDSMLERATCVSPQSKNRP